MASYGVLPPDVAVEFERLKNFPIIRGPKVQLYPQPSVTELEGDEAEQAKERRYRRATHRIRKDRQE